MTVDPIARTRATRYGAGAVAFHWITAILVAVVGTIGLFFDEIPKSAFPGWLTVHALCGLTVFALVIARMWWRRTHTPPDLPLEVGAFTQRASYAVHVLLYILLFVTPVLGAVTFVAHGRSFVFGSLHLGFPFPSTRSVFHPTEKIHQWLAYSLFGLAGVHIVAALWHQFILRDELIFRIWLHPKR